MKRITIKDIASELGIHHSTVSRALRGSPEVNRDTIDKVVEYATKNGYQINRNALYLRGAGSNIIGVVVPNINHGFFASFVSNITRLASAAGYIVAVFQSEESLKQEQEIIKSVIQQNVAGVLASLSMETIDTMHFDQLDRYKIPLVFFDRTNNNLLKPRVILDNHDALRQTVFRLKTMGYSKIAYLSGPSSTHLFDQRQQGYHKGLSDKGIQYAHCIQIANGFTLENGYKASEQLFDKEPAPDAIIFDSNFLAMGAINYLRTHHATLISNIGMACFGGYPWLTLSIPNLISIIQPEEQMAGAAFRLLIEAIEQQEVNNTKSLVFEANFYSP